MIKTIFDIEASCDDRKINPHYNMETIEIGAVKVDNGKIVDEFQTFIKPEYISELTPFCIELTGITFDDLENAPSFNEAILEFFTFIYGTTIYSCGEFDRKFLVRELNEKGNSYAHEMVRNSIQASHVNLKKHYSKITSKKRQGMIGMAEELGVELTGAHHRALDDTRNLTKIFLELESIREARLRDIFNDNRMGELVQSINEHHKNHFKIIMVNNEYTIKELDGAEEVLNQRDLFDRLKSLIRVDHEERYLKYLTKSELKSIDKYTA